MSAQTSTTPAPSAEDQASISAEPQMEVHSQHSGRTGAVVTPDKPKPAKKARAKKSNIPTAVANQTPLRDLEAQMLANLVKVAAVRKDPTEITRPYLAKRFPAMVKLVDRGDLQYYTAARYGSAHDNAWISDALIARLRAGVKKA